MSKRNQFSKYTTKIFKIVAWKIGVESKMFCYYLESVVQSKVLKLGKMIYSEFGKKHADFLILSKQDSFL